MEIREETAKKPITLTREEYRALSPLCRAIADVCLERGTREVVLID